MDRQIRQADRQTDRQIGRKVDRLDRLVADDVNYDIHLSTVQ